MKKILLGVLGVIALGVLGVAGAAASKPDLITMSRSITVAATPADLMPYATDFQKFVQWSPWSGLDPNQKVEFSDPSSGLNAWYSWKGNEDVGSGKMTLTAMSDTEIRHHLQFITPFESEADATLHFEPAGDQVKVTWGYEQQADFPAKLMAVFIDMDEMLGPDYEKGLANLKGMAETAAAERIAAARKAEEEARAAEEAAQLANGEAPAGDAPNGG